MQFPGFFDEEFKLERISTLGDPLECLNQVVNWRIFSEILLKAAAQAFFCKISVIGAKFVCGLG